VPWLELPHGLSEQARLTQTLFPARPRYATCHDFSPGVTPEALCRNLSEHANLRVKYGSVGPSSGDVSERRR